jgi:hypothetical protein
MTDDELVTTWTTLEPTTLQRRRLDARVAAWLEARDTPLAVEWLGLLKVAPISTATLAAVGAMSIALAITSPVVWFAGALLRVG